MKKMTLISIASFPVGIALLWLVPFLGSWKAAGPTLRSFLLIAIVFLVIAAPVLILISLFREPSKKARLIITGNIILWVICAVALSSLLWGPEHRF